MKRALIIEKLPCHHELIPTWVWLLSEIGFNVDVLARAPQHRDITKYMSTIMGLSFRLVNNAKMTDYDLVINNSLYPQEISKVYKGKKLTLSVLHSLPAASEHYPKICLERSDDHYTVALGPHIQRELISSNVKNILLPPIFFGSIPDTIKKVKNTFIVQGVLEPFRRNYNVIPQIINEVRDDAVEFVITLLGDLQTDNLIDSLQAKINNPRFRGKLQCKPNLTYDHFLFGIRSSAWVMPLVDNTFSHGYFSQKITSSVMLAIGNETPLILHSRLAEIYSLTDGENCLTYEDNCEKKVFQRALDMSSEEYESIKSNVSHLRIQWLENILKTARATFKNYLTSA